MSDWELVLVIWLSMSLPATLFLGAFIRRGAVPVSSPQAPAERLVMQPPWPEPTRQ